MEDELIVELANGFTLRSASVEYTAGDYVRLVDPNGDEVILWEAYEWAAEPVLIMGSIIAAAANAPLIGGTL